jgi:hypothetical protein
MRFVSVRGERLANGGPEIDHLTETDHWAPIPTVLNRLSDTEGMLSACYHDVDDVKSVGKGFVLYVQGVSREEWSRERTSMRVAGCKVTYLMTEIILNSLPPPGSSVESNDSHSSVCEPGSKSSRIVMLLSIDISSSPDSRFGMSTICNGRECEVTVTCGRKGMEREKG